jgi:hypothetical protein
MSLQDDQIELDKIRAQLETSLTSLSAVMGGGAGGGAAASPLPKHLHYKIFRDYIEHEDSLINERLLWNITIQGALMAAYGFSIQKLADVVGAAGATPSAAATSEATGLHRLIMLLPFIGGPISLLSWTGVLAAQTAIRRLEATWVNVAEKEHPPGPPTLPGIVGGGGGETHGWGLIAPNLFPWLFVLAWVALAVNYH